MRRLKNKIYLIWTLITIKWVKKETLERRLRFMEQMLSDKLKDEWEYKVIKSVYLFRLNFYKK